MSALLRLHVVLVASTIALALGYAAWEGAHAAEHSTARAAAGVGVPALAAVALGAYLVTVVRKLRRMAG